MYPKVGKIMAIKIEQEKDMCQFLFKSDGSRSTEWYYLWGENGEPFDYIYQSVRLTMLRDALAHASHVEFQVKEGSNTITYLLVGK